VVSSFNRWTLEAGSTRAAFHQPHRSVDAATRRTDAASPLTSGPLPGVLAPNARLRSEIIPRPADNATEHKADRAHADGAPARMSWRAWSKRVFDIDMEHWPYCGGALKVIAAIEEPTVIPRILRAYP
jgi:hypothetical protein